MWREFLAYLHRGGAYAYLHYLPQRRSLWYAVGDDPGVDPVLARTNLYFSVHPCTQIPLANAHGEPRPPEWVRSQLWCIAAINCLFAEYDAKDYGNANAIMEHIESLPVAPSVLVASGGGVHAYWLLDTPWLITNDPRRVAAKHVQAEWVKVVGGDNGAHDLCRVLRVPGSWNYKYTPRREVEWLRIDLGTSYPLKVLTAHIPPMEVPSVPRARIAPPIDTPRPIETFNAAHLVGDVLASRGYRWHGKHKMLSPWSSTGVPGVTIDDGANRAYCHHGSDPLNDGYWKRPFDVVRVLDYAGDFRAALNAIQEGRV